MSTLRLYLDEDITDALARVLRARGFDVVSVHDVNLAGRTDVEQLGFACAQQRVLISFNVKHFAVLAREYASQGKEHSGIVLSNQLPFGELLRRVLNLLRLQSSENLHNRVEWLQNYK